MPLQIADALAHDIIEERYAPGARLNENQNAAQWGVSRSPLREALRILEKRGLSLQFVVEHTRYLLRKPECML